jgi:hypothetical protein
MSDIYYCEQHGGEQQGDKNTLMNLFPRASYLCMCQLIGTCVLSRLLEMPQRKLQQHSPPLTSHNNNINRPFTSRVIVQREMASVKTAYTAAEQQSERRQNPFQLQHWSWSQGKWGGEKKRKKKQEWRVEVYLEMQARAFQNWQCLKVSRALSSAIPCHHINIDLKEWTLLEIRLVSVYYGFHLTRQTPKSSWSTSTSLYVVSMRKIGIGTLAHKCVCPLYFHLMLYTSSLMVFVWMMFSIDPFDHYMYHHL